MGLLVAVIAAAVVTIVVINNKNPETAGTPAPPVSTSESSGMTGRTIGARSLPASVPATSESSSASSTASPSTSGQTGGPTVSPRPGSSSSGTTSSQGAPAPTDGLAVGDCVQIVDSDDSGVSLAPLDCDDQDATYLVQADGYEPCDDYEVTLKSPEDPDRALCLDFNVEEGDCLTVGDGSPSGDQVQDCRDVQPGGYTYEVLSVQEGTSNAQDCPESTDDALPNVTRDRLVCLAIR